MFRSFLQDEQGATAIEYGLIASLMVLTLIVGLQLYAEAMNDMYSAEVDGSLTETIKNAGS